MKLLIEYIQMAANRLTSSLPGSKRHPVHFASREGKFLIQIQGKQVWAPGCRRWRTYRQGFDERLAEVAYRYGLDDIEPTSEDDWAIDVGGYMGEWSLYMLRKGFNVLAIEPDPTAAECLRRNLEAHAPKNRKWFHDPRVTFNEKKAITFHAEPTNADGSIFPSPTGKSSEVTLQADLLDSIVMDRIGEGAKIRAIKIDAEGAEPEVLNGAANTLKNCFRVGVDTGAERMGSKTTQECSEILKNYNLTIIRGHNPLVDSLVVAENQSK